MSDNLRYPIGQQDFQSIREENKIYVDKTEIIYRLVTGSKYIFLSRPRRFGKSLLLSTIKAYFEGRKDLFKGLAIESLEKDWKKYPVIYLSLARINGSRHDSLLQGLNQQFEIIEKELGIRNENSDFGSRFSTIILESYKKYGQRVVILVDEYDNPLINTLHNEEIHEKNRDLLKSIYSNLKDLDGYIRFGMLTGVSRFSKMTIFSGLNNLTDITFDNRYATICGFTEEEIKKFLWPGVEKLGEVNACSPEEALHKLKAMYDGYHFSKKCPDIYNPFSLLLSLDKKEISDYWMETATPTFLAEKLKASSQSFYDIFNDNVGESELSESETSFSSPTSLLYQTGYLTIKGYNREADTYRLGVPNKEVERGLFRFLLKEFTGSQVSRLTPAVDYMVADLKEGRAEEFMENLRIFLSEVPYTVIPKVTEKYFQNTMYLIFRVAGLNVDAERVYALGRSDVVVQTDRYIYIFELKLDKSAEAALRQIENKKYDLPYRHDSRKIIKVGVNFSSKTRNIKRYLIG